MRRISPWYLGVLVLWLATGTAFIIYNNKSNFLSTDDTNLLLGLISVAISILSLGLATMKSPEFKGDILCWNNKTQEHNINNSVSGCEIGLYNWISFKVQNKDKEAIKSLTVNFRFPTSIFCERRQDKLKDKVINIKNSVIYTSDAIKFLGTNKGDCELIFEHLVKISEMSKPNIYMTISGDNIRPTTFVIKKKLGIEIANSDSKHTIKLPKVK
jgi:hypothetical protein|tara:strand:- start:3670 stop:4311 length:642 start_codon:yes stop_codon:yes gene_type:complete